MGSRRPPQQHGQPSPGPAVAWDQPSASGSAPSSSAPQGLQTQDWVCEPPERGRPSRRWSVSIDDRRRLAALGRERLGTAQDPAHGRDIAQIVAQLVSEDVDKDVLLPHPLRSAASSNAFRAFLERSAPFWQNASVQPQASRPPPPKSPNQQ